MTTPIMKWFFLEDIAKPRSTTLIASKTLGHRLMIYIR